MKDVPPDARTDLSVSYEGVWREPNGPKPFPLWVRRVRPAPESVECFEVAWSDSTSMIVDEEEVRAAGAPAAPEAAAPPPREPRIRPEPAAPVVAPAAAVEGPSPSPKRSPKAKKPVAKKAKTGAASGPCPVSGVSLVLRVVGDDDADRQKSATYKYVGTPGCGATHALTVNKRAPWFKLDDEDARASFEVVVSMREGFRFDADERETGELDFGEIHAYMDRYEENRHRLTRPDEPPMMRWSSIAGYSAVFEVDRTPTAVQLKLLAADVDLGDRGAILKRCA